MLNHKRRTSMWLSVDCLEQRSHPRLSCAILFIFVSHSLNNYRRSLGFFSTAGQHKIGDTNFSRRDVYAFNLIINDRKIWAHIKQRFFNINFYSKGFLHPSSTLENLTKCGAFQTTINKHPARKRYDLIGPHRVVQVGC